MKQMLYIMIALSFLAGCARSSARTAASAAAQKNIDVQARAQEEASRDREPRLAEQRVYFPFASDHILPEAVEKIDRNIGWLKESALSYIILEGHCDEAGQSEYNMQLGDRRARAVKAYMIERGISPERIIMVVSYGSTRPLNPGHRVEDLRDNRRVEFVLR
jgi:peptidoglycan-associated lipoprotein